MRRFILALLLCSASLVPAWAAEPAPATPATPTTAPLELWYAEPAREWTEAIPVGNGQLGAMIFGKTDEERLQLNEITVWSGKPQPEADRPEAYKHLPEIRKLLREEKYAEAEKLVTAHMTNQGGGFDGAYSASYQTLGDLKLKFDPLPGPVSEYRRWLDLGTAVAGVRYKAGADVYTREIFSSFPNHAIIMRLASSRKGAVGFTLSLTRPVGAKTRYLEPNTLLMKGTTSGKPDDLRYEAQVRVLTTGGKVKPVRTEAGDQLVVSGADEAVVFLGAGTDYILNYSANFKGEDPHAAVTEAVEGVAAYLAKFPFQGLRDAHVSDYQRFFNRLSLDLGRTANAALPTAERLRRFAKGEADPALVTLFYQFGRYLLISSSRPYNMLPANSQGLWGDGLELPWHCDYKSNINFQMNYWPAETANLSELHLPLIRLLQEFQHPGHKTAKAYFNSEGWVLAMMTNAWGWTSPGWAGPWGPWFGGGGWLCRHLWDHYAFTRNKTYLNLAYPVMAGAAYGYLSILTPDEKGFLVTSPSTSPENTFKTDKGVKSWVCEGAAAERQIIWDVMNNTLLAIKTVKTENEPIYQDIQKAIAKIRPPEIGRGGQLMEWGKDWDLNAPEPHHRHLSHLYALFPGNQITPFTSATLADAAQKSLELRGDGGTGWSTAWKINLWARLHDGNRAYKLLQQQLRLVDAKTKGGGTYANLFDAHPPFQIDGNFGAVSGVNEMLLQSHEMYNDPSSKYPDNYVVHLLPALPATWSAGSVKGLRARGGLEIDIAWKEGKITSTVFRNKTNDEIKFRLRYAGRLLDITILRGAVVALDGNLNQVY